MSPEKVTVRVGVGVCYGSSDGSQGTCRTTGVGWPGSHLQVFISFDFLISRSCNELFNQELLNWLAVIPDLMAESDNLILIHKREGLIMLQRSEASGLSPGERTAQAACCLGHGRLRQCLSCVQLILSFSIFPPKAFILLSPRHSW